MNYYKVDAKCGHVRRRHYIIKAFYVKAENGKEAAAKVRMFPRVKHHWKDAIVSVCKISYEEYISGQAAVNDDLYFKVTNSSDQRILQCVNYDEIHEREVPTKKQKENKLNYYIKMEKILSRDFRIQITEVI